MTLTTSNMSLLQAQGTDNARDYLKTFLAQSLASVDAHDHSSTKGVPVKRLANGTFASRPAAGNAGHVYLATDSNRVTWDNGSSWIEAVINATSQAVSLGGGLTVTAGGLTVAAGGLTVAAGGANITGAITAAGTGGFGAWTTFAPQGNQSVALTTVVNYAAYLLVGKLAIVQLRLNLTSAGTPGNAITVSGIPAAIAPKRIDGTLASAGVAQYYVGATGVQHLLVATFNAASNFILQKDGVAGLFGANPAVTAASGDFVSALLTYEVA